MIKPTQPPSSGGSGDISSYIVTSVGDPGLDSKVPSEQAVREVIPNLSGYVQGTLVTSVGNPGSDVNVPTEKAVRDVIPSLSGYVQGTLVTSVGNPGSDTNIPSEQAVREALTAKVLYGTGDPPSASGVLDGTLYVKYTA
jgi:hypothetical protein